MTFEEMMNRPLSRVSGIDKNGKHVWWNVDQNDAVNYAKGIARGGHVEFIYVKQEDGEIVYRWADEIGSTQK